MEKCRFVTLLKSISVRAMIALSATGVWAQDQVRRDAWVVGADYQINHSHYDSADPKYNMWGIDVMAGYEKFVYRNFFVMPQINVFYRQMPDDKTGATKYADGPFFDNIGHRAWQWGGGVSAMMAYRWQVCQGVPFAIDVMTGPVVDFSFKSKTPTAAFPGYADVMRDNLYNRCVFSWRFGLAFNAAEHVRISIAYNVSTGKTSTTNKDLQTNKWAYSGLKNPNYWTLGIGYRF